MKKKSIWAKLDEVFNALPGYIDSEIKAADNSVNTIGRNNVVINSSIVKQSSSSSTSTIVQAGKKIVIKTKNGKTAITINGKEYVPKGEK